MTASEEHETPSIQRDEHPLFPALGDEDDPPEVGSLSMCRWNQQRGRNEYIPRRFAAEEIQDLSQIFELYGGGRYELIGRNREGNRIVAKRQYEIAGPEKPIFPDLPPEPPKQSASAPPSPSPAPQWHPPAQQQQLSFAALAPVVLPLVLEYLKSSAVERQAQSTQLQQMMLSMMQQQQASSQAFITAMSNLHASAASHGTGSRADFMAGIEFAENMLAGKMEELQKTGSAADPTEIFKTIGAAFELLKMVPAGTGGAAGAAAQALGGGAAP